ncbi:DUF1616 domain-containing protein [Methanococcoides sp. SA1]|nr:DUF1616 domain-containing protein [Methanococcoides sp. SA1]
MKKNVILLLSILLVSQACAYTFCDEGENGKSDLRLISIDDMLKTSNKEWAWEPGTEVELEIRVENKEDESNEYELEIIFMENDNKENIAEDNDDLEKEFSLSANERKTISLEFEVDDDADLDEYQVYVKFYEKGNEEDKCQENSEETVLIEKVELCEDEADKDDLQILKIQDERKDNDDEWNWKPGDDIEITLQLENSEYSERNFQAELVLLNEDNEEVEMTDNPSRLIEDKEVEEGETEEFEFEFKIKPGLPEGEYTLYAKVQAEDNDNICTSMKAYDSSNPKTIQIEKAERNVVIKNVIGPAIAKTHSEVQYNATIINLGSEEEEKAQAIIYNNQLNLIEKITTENLEAGEERNITFTFTVPENASLEQHAILFSTEFDYNEKQDYYGEESDSDDDIKRQLTITAGTEPEEEIEEITNQTIIEIATIEEEITEEQPTTTITGNVVGSSDNSTMIWAISIIAILALAGTYLFLKKKSPIRTQVHPEPKIARRYTASLN